MNATAQLEMVNANAKKGHVLDNQQPSIFTYNVGCSMMKVQRLAERRSFKRSEMRGLNMRKTVIDRFSEKVCKVESGCHEWTSCIMPNGYGQMHYKGKTAYAHRVAYEIYKGEIPENLFVMHSCDNRKCVNPDHLSLGTFDDNMIDMVKKSRQASGERNSHAKLTNEQVLKIREIAKPHNAIAKEFNVSRTTVSEIKARKIWKHI